MLNLTPAWRERAGWLRQPADVLWLVAGIYASRLIQRVFGPAQGKRAAVPIKRFTRSEAPVAQRIADRTRMLAALEERRDDLTEPRLRLDLDVLRLYLGNDAAEEAIRASPLGSACLD